MSSRQGKCRTCNGCDKLVGNYCADCTTNYVRKKCGWDKVKWWAGIYNGDDAAHIRMNKQDLFNNMLTGYCLGGHEVENAEDILKQEIRWILDQSPPCRGSAESVNEKVDLAARLINRRIQSAIGDSNVGKANQ